MGFVNGFDGIINRQKQCSVWALKLWVVVVGRLIKCVNVGNKSMLSSSVIFIVKKHCYNKDKIDQTQFLLLFVLGIYIYINYLNIFLGSMRKRKHLAPNSVDILLLLVLLLIHFINMYALLSSWNSLGCFVKFSVLLLMCSAAREGRGCVFACLQVVGIDTERLIQQ